MPIGTGRDDLQFYFILSLNSERIPPSTALRAVCP